MTTTLTLAKDTFGANLGIFTIDRLVQILPENAFKNSEDNVEIILAEDSTLIDERIVLDVLTNYRNSSVSVKFLGGVNGTVPLEIKINGGYEERVYCVPYQGLHGVNLAVSRPLRKKIFDAIHREFPDLINTDFLSFTKVLKTEKVRDICLTYGETHKKLDKIEICPFCSARFFTPLTVDEGNSITGFLEASHKVYHFCNSCSLVFLSLQVAKEDLGIFYTEYSYGRSQSEREILAEWDNLSETTTSHFGNYKIGIEKINSNDVVLDLGCGSGHFLSIVRDHHPDASLTGVDFFIPSPIVGAFSKKNIRGVSADIIQYIQSLDQSYKVDVVTMWEVIEHIKIDDLRLLLKLIRDVLKPGGRFIFSTPDFFDDHCRSLDFWAMAPGEHLYVYNLNLCRLLLAEAGFQVLQFEKESVTTKLPNRWYEYGRSTNSTQSARSSAAIIESLLACDNLREDFKDWNRKVKVGSELIVVAIPKHIA